jgi:hypothetical protein
MDIKSVFNKVVSCFTNCCGDWTAPKSTELNFQTEVNFSNRPDSLKNGRKNNYSNSRSERKNFLATFSNYEAATKKNIISDLQKNENYRDIPNTQKFQFGSSNSSAKSISKTENVIPRKNEKLNSSSNSSKGVSKTSHQRKHAIFIGDKKKPYEESNKYFKKFNSTALDERCKELEDAFSKSQKGSLVQIFNKYGQHYLTIQRITKNSDELYELHCNSMEFTKAQVEDGYNTNPVPYSALSKAAKYEIIQPAEKEA